MKNILLAFLTNKNYSKTILEFKGSVQCVQKGHPTLVTQVDLILQNW